MADWRNTGESSEMEGTASALFLNRRALLGRGITLAGALSTGARLNAVGATAPSSMQSSTSLDAAAEAKKIAFDRVGQGEKSC